MVQTLLTWIGQYISYFPLVIFFSLLLGGFNIPISEDILVITAAILGRQDRASIPFLLISLYCGAVLSDLIVYFWGWLLGKGKHSARFFKKLLKEENTNRFSIILEKYGCFTFIFGRFIPFGIRNIVSLTSGFLQFPFYKFMLFDGVAAVCNISALFWLVFFLGSQGGYIMKIIGIVFFVLFIAILIYILRPNILFHAKPPNIQKHS